MDTTRNDNLISFQHEKKARTHKLHDKRLEEVHNAFEKAFPLPTSHNKKKKPKKQK